MNVWSLANISGSFYLALLINKLKQQLNVTINFNNIINYP